MALRALMLNKKLGEKKQALEALREKIEGFAVREAELESAIEEAESDEEKATVEEAVEAFETEKAETEEEAKNLEEEVRELEKELETIEPKEEPQAEERKAEPVVEKREKEIQIMKKRFKDMTYDERTAFVQREDVQKFLGQVRTAIAEKRTISNAGYLIPQIMLGLLRENIIDYSKLYNRVDLRQLSGQGRMVIEGTVPEAIWTEACANLNELDLSFDKVEVDGYKCGGYFKVCNASLEDSDIDLAGELMTALGQAIGLAVDKAIIFGTGTKMPTGIITTLKAVSGTPNIISHANTVKGKALVQALIGDIAKAKANYSRGEKLWVMNETTYSFLLAEFVEVDANGAYVSVVNGVMPVVGGDIIVLNFMPDYVICAGYFDLYLLAERQGTEISMSEHVFWTADQTGFKGTARYDGKVLRNDAFVGIGVNGADGDDMVVVFPSDSANF